MIVHPDSKHLAAIAAMDPQKVDQKKDCLDAIKVMMEIREDIQRRTNQDIAKSKKISFLGYEQVPTWTGFIGVKEAQIYLYPTRPYRGDLVCLRVASLQGNRRYDALIYDSYKKDFDELMRGATSNPTRFDLWNHRPA
jgi:hypothetical protein